VKHIYQPPGSSLCGQTCVAMITGISLDESIQLFDGKRGGTRTRDLVNALANKGIQCGDKLVRLKGQAKPNVCIVKLHFDDSKVTHWVVWHNGRFYDPSYYGDGQLNAKKNEYQTGVRETSYLPVHL
jgi:hypothetical protein